MDEHEAIRRLKSGKIDGLEALVMRYQTQALRAANMILHDRSRAEDIVQGAFIRVYRQIGTFDPARAFRPWFMCMVVNEALRATTGRADLSLDKPVHALDDEGELGEWFPDDTAGPEGLDCSPRGDLAGFVRIHDEKTLMMPDRRGNNRIDSLRNIVRDPREIGRAHV